MDCSLPDSSVHGILQARILEWVAFSFSKGFSQLKDQTHVSCISCIDRWVLHYWATWEAQSLLYRPHFQISHIWSTGCQGFNTWVCGGRIQPTTSPNSPLFNFPRQALILLSLVPRMYWMLSCSCQLSKGGTFCCGLTSDENHTSLTPILPWARA